MKPTMDLVGFDDFIHCRHLNMLFLFFRNEGYQSVHGFLLQLPLDWNFVYLCSRWGPILGCTQISGKKTTKLSGILLQFKSIKKNTFSITWVCTAERQVESRHQRTIPSITDSQMCLQRCHCACTNTLLYRCPQSLSIDNTWD